MIATYPPMLGVLPEDRRFNTQTISTKKQEKVRLFAILFAGG
jgi:hypothetical protein